MSSPHVFILNLHRLPLVQSGSKKGRQESLVTAYTVVGILSFINSVDINVDNTC